MQTQYGQTNPHDVDNTTTWLNWDRLDEHQDIWRFFQGMIAFRKAHPSLSRSRFWRDDVSWYGARGKVDLSGQSRAFALCVRGASQGDDDIYAIFNAYWEPVIFEVQAGGPWRRVVDTSLASPDDICTDGSGVSLQSDSLTIGPRSMGSPGSVRAVAGLSDPDRAQGAAYARTRRQTQWAHAKRGWHHAVGSPQGAPERRRAGADERLLAGGQLPVGRPDLPAGQPAAEGAAAARAHQAAAARALGHHAGAELHLRAPEPGHQEARPEHDLRHRPGPRRRRASWPTPTWRAPTASSTRTSRRTKRA